MSAVTPPLSSVREIDDTICGAKPADKDAKGKLVDSALKLLADEQQANRLRINIARLAKPEATKDIVNEIERLIA